MSTKVILEYQTGGRTLRLGTTGRLSAVRAVRDALMADAAESSRALDDLDPALQAIKAAEVRRLAKVLTELIPAHLYPEAEPNPVLGLKVLTATENTPTRPSDKPFEPKLELVTPRDGEEGG